MEIYAAPKLSKYRTAVGTYNVKSFTYKLINTCMSTHIHTQVHTCVLRHARTHKHVVRNSYLGKYVRETKVEG